MKFKCLVQLSLKHSRSSALIFCDLQFNHSSLPKYPPIHDYSTKSSTFTSASTTTTADVKNPQIIYETSKICRILSNLGPRETVESTMNSAGFEMSPILVQEVLRKLSNAGLLALSFFRWAEKQNGYKGSPDSYNSLIEALGKIKQFKMVWNLVDEMRQQGLLLKDTFALISRRYARARKVKEAVEAFKSMEKFGLTPDLQDYNRLIDTLSKSKQVEHAQQVFDEWKKREFKPNIRSYTILLEGWGQEQNFLRLNEVYREMRDDGFEPDVVCYGILITAYCRARRYDEAVELFWEMERKSIRASPHIYCTLINGFGSEKRLDEALKFFELAKTSGQALEAPTYNAVVGAYCWSRQFPNTFEIMHEMRRYGIGPNSRTYDIVLNHLIKAHRSRDAYAVFQNMSAEPGCEPTVSTYAIIVRMCCNEGRIDLALNVWNQMKAKGILPGMHMFSILINSLSLENKLDDACKHFQEMLDLGIRPPTPVFSNLKQALLDEGKKDDVLTFTKKLEKLRTTQISG